MGSSSRVLRSVCKSRGYLYQSLLQDRLSRSTSQTGHTLSTITQYRKPSQATSTHALSFQTTQIKEEVFATSFSLPLIPSLAILSHHCLNESSTLPAAFTRLQNENHLQNRKPRQTASGKASPPHAMHSQSPVNPRDTSQ